MALALSKVYRGPVTIDFIYTAGPTTHLSYSGIKADVLVLNIEQKETTETIEDGQEIKNADGWTGTAELKVSQLDDTDLQTLEDQAPGTATGVDKIKVTFTALGNGSDHYIEITGISSLVVAMETGGTWKLVLKYGITAAASAKMHDFVSINKP